MRFYLILGLFLGFGSQVVSQTKLWGTVEHTDNGVGLIYKFNVDGSGFEVIVSFDIEAKAPLGSLMDGGDGYAYGAASHVVYRIKKDGTGFERIHEFPSITPLGGMILLNEFIYGVTRDGGPFDFGFIYKMKRDGSEYQTVYEFTGMSTANTGASPSSGLLVASDGKIYGTTSSGGGYGNGTIFRLDPATDTFTKLRAFGDFEGATPNGYLVEGADGFLYGTTSKGYGSPSAGSVFKIDKNGAGFSYLKSFNAYASGQNIYSPVILMADGSLRGTFNYGGANGNGGVFKINTDGSGYQIIHNFDGTNGSSPQGPLYLLNGFIYVQASNGVYKLKPDGTEFTFVAGVSTNYTLSNLGGTIFKTEPNGYGAIGVLDEANNKFNYIKAFYPKNGGQPVGKPIQHSNGYLYGVTLTGGSQGSGTIYRIDPATHEFATVHNVSFPSYLRGTMIEDVNGKILGVMRSNDNHDHLYEFDPKDNSFVDKLTLENLYVDQLWEIPTGEIFFNTYETSSSLYKIDSAHMGYTKLINEYVIGPWSVLPDTTHSMVGTTVKGGDFSRIIKYDYVNQSLKTLYEFDTYFGGASLLGDLCTFSDNKLMGITTGVTGQGFIFSINKDGSQLQKHAWFSGSNNQPREGLTKASDSVFVGVTANNNGSVFRYHVKDGYSVVKHLDEVGSSSFFNGLPGVSFENTPMLKVYGSLIFGEVEVEESSELNVIVKNFGTGELSVTDIILPDGFSIDEKAFSLSPGEIKKIAVKFLPMEERSYEGSLKVISNDANGLSSLFISGEGIIITKTEDELSQLIDVYPNPTNGKILIRGKEGRFIGNVVIHNSLGDVVLKENTFDKQELVVNLESVQDGLYFLTASNGSGVLRKKIIKR